jgi:hypothetical protein
VAIERVGRVSSPPPPQLQRLRDTGQAVRDPNDVDAIEERDARSDGRGVGRPGRQIAGEGDGQKEHDDEAER